MQRVKNHLHDRAATTINTVLTTLSVMLKVAVEWDVIDSVPCTKERDEIACGYRCLVLFLLNLGELALF